MLEDNTEYPTSLSDIMPTQETKKKNVHGQNREDKRRKDKVNAKTRNELPKQWPGTSENFVEYVLKNLSNGGQVKKIDIKTLCYPQHVLQFPNVVALIDILFKLLRRPGNQIITYRKLASYIFELAQTFVETSQNFQGFWAKVSHPMNRMKMETIVESEFGLRVLARLKEQDLGRQEKLLVEWMRDEQSSVFREMLTDVIRQLCFHRNKVCVADPLDIAGLNHAGLNQHQIKISEPLLTKDCISDLADIAGLKHKLCKSCPRVENPDHAAACVTDTMDILGLDHKLCRLNHVEITVPKAYILDTVDIMWLNHKLCKRLDHMWTLLYEADLRRDSLKNLAAALDKRRFTLLLIKDTMGNLYGAYNGSQWIKSDLYHISTDCLIFHVGLEDKIHGGKRFLNTGRTHSYLNTSGSPGLFIGALTGQVGLWLPKEFGRGYCRPSSLGGPLLEEESFIAELIQVWQIDGEKD